MIEELKDKAPVIIGLLFVFAMGRSCENSQIKACFERNSGNRLYPTTYERVQLCVK